MGSGYLPVTRDWKGYIERSDAMMSKLDTEIEADLQTAVDAALVHLDHMSDPWLCHLDWTGIATF
jgi:hypothetical protein